METVNLDELIPSREAVEPQYNMPTTAPTDKMSFSIEEAAVVTSIGRSNLFKAIRERKLIARKLGRRTIILQSDLQAFLEALPVAGSVQ